MIKKILISLFLCTTLFAQRELVNKRTYNSKTFVTGKTFTTEIHAGHIHYKNGNSFEPVDYTLEDMGTYWRMVKASYNLYVAKDFGASQLIRFDNKYEGADHTIYYEPHSLQWVNKNNPNDRVLIKSAQNVTGVLDGHTITYVNAFGSDIDFVVQLRRSGFQKYIRFNSQPAFSPPGADYVPVLLFKYQGDGLTVKASGSPVWDGTSVYEGIDGFEISEGNYKTYLREAYIWDSSNKRQKVKLFFEKRDGVLWQAKVMPASFFSGSTYPVYCDATTNYAPTAGDGYVESYATATTWDTIHDAAAGSSAPYTGATLYVLSFGNGTTMNQGIDRAFFPIDTSALSDVATITAATLYVYVTAVVNGDNDGNDFLTICQTNQASTSELVVGDYDECGESTLNGWSSAESSDIIEGIDAGSRKDLTGLGSAQYQSFALNATGLGWISKTGITKLGMREGHDILDDPLTLGPALTQSGVGISGSEQAGTNQDPYLSVSWYAYSGRGVGRGIGRGIYR